ncbi:MAG: spore coat associated protein CotJA [Peptococcaceae bacterium]|nr:spore coat associated protein CotJA [Peptococcaceae bacterium]MDH7525211.1 spore coat associated protein CotJA [Peptococcaceae bacterium]
MKNFTFKIVPGPPGSFNHLPPKPSPPGAPPPSRPAKSEQPEDCREMPGPCPQPYYGHMPAPPAAPGPVPPGGYQLPDHPPCPYYQPQYPPAPPAAPVQPAPTAPPGPFAAAKIAHAYVPWQYYRVVYPPSEALDKGTLFPELYQPQGVYGPCEGPEPCRVYGPWGGAPYGGN